MQYQEINSNGHEVQLDGVVGIEGDGTVLLGLGALLVSGVSCLLVSRKTLLNNKGKLAKIYFRTLIDSTIVLVHLLDANCTLTEVHIGHYIQMKLLLLYNLPLLIPLTIGLITPRTKAILPSLGWAFHLHPPPSQPGGSSVCCLNTLSIVCVLQF